jgi:hypothetical protein
VPLLVAYFTVAAPVVPPLRLTVTVTLPALCATARLAADNAITCGLAAVAVLVAVVPVVEVVVLAGVVAVVVVAGAVAGVVVAGVVAVVVVAGVVAVVVVAGAVAVVVLAGVVVVAGVATVVVVAGMVVVAAVVVVLPVVVAADPLTDALAVDVEAVDEVPLADVAPLDWPQAATNPNSAKQDKRIKASSGRIRSSAKVLLSG